MHAVQKYHHPSTPKQRNVPFITARTFDIPSPLAFMHDLKFILDVKILFFFVSNTTVNDFF